MPVAIGCGGCDSGARPAAGVPSPHARSEGAKRAAEAFRSGPDVPREDHAPFAAFVAIWDWDFPCHSTITKVLWAYRTNILRHKKYFRDHVVSGRGLMWLISGQPPGGGYLP